METEFISFQKIIIFGAEGTGKFTLIKKLQNDINLEKETSKKNESKLLNLSLFEIRLDYKNEFIYNADNMDSLLYGCKYVIFLIDLTNIESFELAKNLIKIIKKENYGYLNLMILYNKFDLEDLIQITEKNLKDILDLNPNLKYKKISLKNDNIKHLLYEIDKDMNKYNVPPNFVLESTKMKNQAKAEIHLNFIFLGDSATGGKTSFLKKYKNGNCETNINVTTIGFDKEVYYKKINKDFLKISLFDIAGQERFKCLPKKYYQNADGIFLSFDVTKEESFNNINLWLKDIYENINNNNDCIKYLVGNKIDLINDRKISKEVAKSFAESKGMRYFESSAVYNFNVAEIIDTMIFEAYSNIKNIPFKFFFPMQESELNKNYESQKEFELIRRKKKDTYQKLKLQKFLSY